MPITEPTDLTGAPVIGRGPPDRVEDTYLGRVKAIYFDETGRAEWAGITSGASGAHVWVVPLAGSEHDRCGLRVPYGKAQLQHAPHHDPGPILSPDDKADLSGYYARPHLADYYRPKR